MQFKQTQLDNGLAAVGEVNPAAASMALGFFVRTGSRDETARIAGASHFLEHMMFKGTVRRSPFDINREFDEIGAMYNAFTSEENTVYFGAVLPEFQDRLLDLLADMMRPALRETDFQTERKVILEEIALYDDRPQHRLYEKLLAVHFAEHPLANSVLGTRQTIGALQQPDMLEYFTRRYSPGNLTLVAVGNFDWERLVGQARQACGKWQPQLTERKLADTRGSLRTEFLADAKLVRQHITLMCHGPSAQDDRRYAAHVLATVLGDSTGSRLFYALIDPAIAEDASCGFEEFDGTGGFLTYVCADPERASQALEIVRQEYQRFVREGPTEAEMLAARNKIASAATLKGEIPMGRLTAVGFDWVYRHNYMPLVDQIDRILSIKGEDILELARQYDIANTTLVTLGPKDKL